MRHKKRAEISQKMIVVFNINDINHLAFLLGVEHDELSGETRTTKADSLISYLERRRRIKELLELLNEYRPDEEWPELDEIDLIITNSRPLIIVLAIFFLFILVISLLLPKPRNVLLAFIFATPTSVTTPTATMTSTWTATPTTITTSTLKPISSETPTITLEPISSETPTPTLESTASSTPTPTIIPAILCPSEPTPIFCENFDGNAIRIPQWDIIEDLPEEDKSVFEVHDGWLHMNHELNGDEFFDPRIEVLYDVNQISRFKTMEIRAVIEGGSRRSGIGLNTSCSEGFTAYLSLKENDTLIGSYGPQGKESQSIIFHQIETGSPYIIRLVQDNDQVRIFVNGEELDEAYPCNYLGDWLKIVAGIEPNGSVQGKYDYVVFWDEPVFP